MMSCFLKHTSILFCFLLIFSLIPAFSGQCNEDDKKVLEAINAHFGFPSTFASWTNDTDCCGWNGISCYNGRVVILQVYGGTELNGTIPEVIGDLPFLQEILFNDSPKLVGSIPSSITKLTGLNYLDLTRNSLSGPIPSFLSQLTSLIYLSLASNQFSGSIPPSLSNLTNLGTLWLNRNQLTGPIPDSFGSFPVNSPPILYLSRNKLSGPIPSSLGVPQWPKIRLQHNMLTGDASVLFGASKSTRYIDISSNQFAFDLTNVEFPLNAKLLDLSQNMIYGNIPAQLNQLNNLRYFNVSYNRLCGEIPVGSVTAEFGVNSYFHNKCLCGAPLPPCT